LLLINQRMSDIQLSAEDQQKLDAAALKIQARARGMNTRRMSKDDLAVKAQESRRETKEERQARRKAEIQAANAKRHADFEAEAQLDSAAPPEPSDVAAADEAVAPAAAAEAVNLAVPIDIFHGLSEEEIKRRNQAVVKIQSRARGVAVRGSDVKEKAAQRKKDAEHAKMEFQRRLMAANADEDHTIAASELGRTAEDIRIEEQLAAAEVNLQLQAQTYADNLRKEADYKKKREEELQHTSAAANDAAIEHATENKATEVLLARQAEIAAQQKAQASMLAAETFYSGENQSREVAYVMEDVRKESDNQSLKASKGQKNVMFEYNKPARMCSPAQKQALDLIYGACAARAICNTARPSHCSRHCVRVAAAVGVDAARAARGRCRRQRCLRPHDAVAPRQAQAHPRRRRAHHVRLRPERSPAAQGAVLLREPKAAPPPGHVEQEHAAQPGLFDQPELRRQSAGGRPACGCVLEIKTRQRSEWQRALVAHAPQPGVRLGVCSVLLHARYRLVHVVLRVPQVCHVQ
jgi:hypothetical protein